MKRKEGGLGHLSLFLVLSKTGTLEAVTGPSTGKRTVAVGD